LIQSNNASPAQQHHNPHVKSLVIPELQAYAPFDELEPEALDYLAHKLRLAYHARGELILGPDSGVVDRLRIIKQGAVRGSGGPADVVLGPGEAFPLGALAGRRATVYQYRAEADTFCWELEAARFHELFERSARWRAYATQHLAALAERSQRALRGEAAQSALDSAGMLAPLKKRAAARAGRLRRGRDARRGGARMHAERVGSIVVLDAQGLPGGIFTTVDLLEERGGGRRARGAGRGAHEPAPHFARGDSTLADAALAMARHGFRHIVVTRDGRLAGVVSERDLFALQRLGLRRTAERIRGAAALPQLVDAAPISRQLTRHLLAQGVAAGPLTAMVSALNDALTRA
jgi:CBS domain-containing protein